MKKIILLFFTILITVLIPTVCVSYLSNLSTNPDSTLTYKLMRGSEKIRLSVSISPSKKVKYLGNLLEKRLNELEYVVNNKMMAFFEDSTRRYYTTAGQLSEMIIQNNLNKDDFGVSEIFSKHTERLSKLRDTFSYDTAEWRFMMDDINYLKTYSDQLNK